MTAIWQNDGTAWNLLAPTSFSLEAELHELIAENPQLLPLAGSPDLVVVGKEVRLGSGYADLLAVETSGRLVIIEVKLSTNPEAKRAVVAQVLAYAAYLHGLEPDVLEGDVLGTHLRQRGYESLAGAVAANDQEGSLDRAAFADALRSSLAAGAFRLILVLDDAPSELVMLVGYLEAIAEQLTIDLVTVSAYEVGGSRILVPQRVEPARQVVLGGVTTPSTTKDTGALSVGGDEFLASIESAAPESQAELRRLYDWARSLETEGLCRLFSYRGKGKTTTLLPWLSPDNAGLVTIWNDRGAYLSFWRSVFERRAPKSIDPVEQAISPLTVGQGNVARNITDELLAALTQAYREAATSR